MMHGLTLSIDKGVKFSACISSFEDLDCDKENIAIAIKLFYSFGPIGTWYMHDIVP
jgi:hypothetical protein